MHQAEKRRREEKSVRGRRHKDWNTAKTLGLDGVTLKLGRCPLDFSYLHTVLLYLILRTVKRKLCRVVQDADQPL